MQKLLELTNKLVSIAEEQAINESNNTSNVPDVTEHDDCQKTVDQR